MRACCLLRVGVANATKFPTLFWRGSRPRARQEDRRGQAANSLASSWNLRTAGCRCRRRTPATEGECPSPEGDWCPARAAAKVQASVVPNWMQNTPPPAKPDAMKSPRSAAKPSPKPKTAGEPVLLSGGNPQIAKGYGNAPVQAYLAAVPGWKQDLARQLDALIVATVPSVQKAVKWNSPFYGIEGQGWFLNFQCFSKYLKVAFFRGASLSPQPPGVSKHPEVRYLDLHEGVPLDEARVSDWIRQAAGLPGWDG